MTKQQEEEKAPFDDCRAALSFALNADQVTAPTAFMNKAMAAVRIARKKTKKKKRQTEAEVIGELLGPDAMTPEQLLELEEAKRDKRRMGSLVRVAALKFRDGMERHHLAGLILYHLGRLDTEHQIVLTGLHTVAYHPCSCRALCCSGQRPTERWLQAVSDMCSVIQLKADVLKQPGKKGLSSQPMLRRRIVEQYFTHNDRTLASIAGETGVSLMTAAKHRGWIMDYLAACETAAWKECMGVFDAAGITGHHL